MDEVHHEQKLTIGIHLLIINCALFLMMNHDIPSVAVTPDDKLDRFIPLFSNDSLLNSFFLLFFLLFFLITLKMVEGERR